MPQWLLDLMEPERLMTVAFVVFILWMIGRTIFKAFPFIASFVDLVQTLVGDKDNPGIGARMDAQVAKLSELGDKLGDHGDKLETVRAQVQNSHGTNFRDDLDANTESTMKALNRIGEVADKLDQHIGISKSMDAEQEEAARKLDKHIEETSEWTPMLHDLHESWGHKKHIAPEDI